MTKKTEPATAIRNIGKAMGRVERCLDRGDLKGARQSCNDLHGLLERYLGEFGDDLGVNPRSVIPKDPE